MQLGPNNSTASPDTSLVDLGLLAEPKLKDAGSKNNLDYVIKTNPRPFTYNFIMAAGGLIM